MFLRSRKIIVKKNILAKSSIKKIRHWGSRWTFFTIFVFCRTQQQQQQCTIGDVVYVVMSTTVPLKCRKKYEKKERKVRHKMMKGRKKNILLNNFPCYLLFRLFHVFYSSTISLPNQHLIVHLLFPSFFLNLKQRWYQGRDGWEFEVGRK